MKHRSYITPYYAIIAFTVITLAVMFCVFPLWIDDFYLLEWSKTTCDGTPWPIDWDHFRAYWSWNYMNDNARLANTGAAFLLMGPKVLSNIISALLWGFTLLLMGKLAKWHSRQWQYMAMLATLLMIVPTWFISQADTVYQFNYSWATGFSMIALWLFLRQDDINPIFAFVGGGVFGAWHEGFSLPILSAFAALMLLNPRYRTRGRVVFMIAIAIGLTLLLRAHGTAERLGCTLEFSSKATEITLFCAIPTILFFAISIWSIATKRLPTLTHDPLWIALTAICAASMAIKLVTGTNYRAAWPAQVYGCFGIIYLLSLLSKHKTVLNTAAVASLVLLVSHMIVADIQTVKVRHEIDTLIHANIHNPNETLFAPKTSPETAPILALGKPTYPMTIWTNYYSYYHISKEDAFKMKYIPEELAYFDGTQGKPLPSGDVTEYHGQFVADAHGTLGCQQGFFVDAVFYTPFNKYYGPIECTPFYSPVNGRTYLSLQHSHIELHVRPIIDIKIDWNSKTAISNRTVYE